jgi:hypothetical protein
MLNNTYTHINLMFSPAPPTSRASSAAPSPHTLDCMLNLFLPGAKDKC